MAVRIRLSRFGRLHRPYFRIVAIDGRRHREGEASEILGSYDPLLKDKNLQVDLAAVESWVNRGAQISSGVRNLLVFSGMQVPAPKKTAAAKTAADKPAKPKAKAAKPTAKGTYRAPTRRALRKHAAKLKGVRKSALAAETAAKAAAAAAAAPAVPAGEAPKA